VYVGKWKNGLRHGKGYGTIINPTGEKYVGEFKDGKRNGQGTFTFSNGNKYLGKFKNGKFNDQGTFTFLDGKNYVGEFRNGKFHGQGTFTWSDGDKYVGEFKDGERTGQGTLTKPNGDKYVGEFKDGKQDGQGTYTHSDGKKYVGEWKDGYKTGQGTFSTTFGFNFKYNIHSSLRNDWVNEFNLVMNNLDKVIPVKPTNFSSLDIYTWNSSADKPFKNKIGNATGMEFFASISVNEYGIVQSIQNLFIVLEIPADEFKYNPQFHYSQNLNIHRYSVIPHEYFHAFQFSLSNNFIDIKWLQEGAAASFESLYTQQYYNINHFKWAQNKVHIAVVNNPEIFESIEYDYIYSKSIDKNYSSSVFMVLALVKELKKLDITEEKAFKLILNDFWRKNPSDDNWKKVFQEVFNITLENFYLSLKNYTNDINSVLPSESIKLENIFSD